MPDTNHPTTTGSGQLTVGPAEATPPLSDLKEIARPKARVTDLGPATFDASADGPPAAPSPPPTAEPARRPRRRRWLVAAAALVGLAVAIYLLFPRIELAFTTTSTDDAYVNGHVTFVAARVPGQVVRVLVDDNNRVRKGDLLVQLDKEPYQVQVAIKEAAVAAAQADLVAAQAEVRGLEAMGDSQRWQLQQAMEQVVSQIATLRANVATYKSRQATLALAQANLVRGEQLAPSGAMSKEELDVRRQTVKVDEEQVKEALAAVYATRAALGLTDRPTDPEHLADVPPDLEETYSTVRAVLASLLQTAAQIGLPLPDAGTTPRQFLAKAPGDHLDELLRKLVPEAPAVKQAETRLREAQRDLDQARLNLSYCDVYAAIDGVVTRRNVNPGNNVQTGQGLMAVRSLTEIWVDANFKETQLADLRIGQRVDMEVDMYGKSHIFRGRITGFTMGTGSTLALLPAENATGNFIKVVQRLPVRIEPVHYDPDQLPLFIGLSVVPHVYIYEQPTGPHAGEFLQPPVGQTPRHALAAQEPRP